MTAGESLPKNAAANFGSPPSSLVEKGFQLGPLPQIPAIVSPEGEGGNREKQNRDEADDEAEYDYAHVPPVEMVPSDASDVEEEEGDASGRKLPDQPVLAPYAKVLHHNMALPKSSLEQPYAEVTEVLPLNSPLLARNRSKTEPPDVSTVLNRNGSGGAQSGDLIRDKRARTLDTSHRPPLPLPLPDQAGSMYEVIPEDVKGEVVVVGGGGARGRVLPGLPMCSLGYV